VSGLVGPVSIRRARPADGPAVREFVLATFASYGIEPDLEDTDAELVRFGEHGDQVDEFVAVVDDAPVGSVMVMPREDSYAWLSKFFVAQRYRGRGIGRALLARAVEAARARGYRSIGLDTRTAMKEAVHLYEATGWRLDPAGPADGPCEAFYTLDLRPAPQG
jgi:putative acetyltransferase